MVSKPRNLGGSGKTINITSVLNMKNSIRIFFLLSFFLGCVVIGFSRTNSSASVGKKPFQVQLKMKNFTNGYLKLIGMYGDQNYGIDSFLVDAHGNATYKMDSSLPGGLYILIFPDMSLVQMLVDKDQQFTMEFDKDDIINTMNVTGSEDNKLLYYNMKYEAFLSKRMDSVMEQMKKTDKKGMADRKRVV